MPNPKPESSPTPDGDQPVSPTPPAVPPAPEYADDERVCVTFGYGLNEANSQRFFVEDIPFSKDRIARGVLYARAKKLQKHFGDGVLRIHPNDATEAEIARRCGVRPGAPEKVAALLLASDLDAIAAQLAPEDIERLAHAIRARAQALHKA